MLSARNTRLGIVLMTVASFVFIINDSLTKLLGERLPLGEVIFLRGFFATGAIVIAAIAMGEHRRWRPLLSWPVAWRTVGEVGSTASYLTALFHMPIANATTIQQVVPLATTAAGALFLGERVGWRRWTAIGIGFVGMLIVVRPGFEGFDAYSLVVLVTVAFVTMRDLITRTMPPAVSGILVAGLGSGAIMLSGPVIALLFAEEWLVPTAVESIWLAGAGVMLAAGFFTIIVSLRVADMATVAPFRYAMVVFAIVTGFLIWGDVPDALTLLGTAIIIATGVYTFYREKVVSQARRDGPELALRADATLPEV